MPAQIIPIQDVASAGVIKDTPSITLPPNVYSDVSNVRFHSGAVRKMEGELSFISAGLADVVYVAYWQAPSAEYYIVIDDDGSTVNVNLYNSNGNTPLSQDHTFSPGGDWQHTLFNGGFNLVLNNGQDVPHYFSDPAGMDNLTELPNWDSYLSQEEVTTVIWDDFNFDIVLGRTVDFATESILYSVTPRDTSIGILNSIQDLASDTVPYTLNTDDPDAPFITPRRRTETQTGALPGDQITISIRTDASIQVRAGVIRSYGNLLVAGDLTEVDSDDETIVVRRLPGTIRTSDVAAPGQIPLNWNPFRNGANTADEFILSSTGKVQDMAELQGVMYVYTDVSIHAIQQTGNPAIPFQISTTTDSYGANSLGAVMEFDGRHLVVGSQDIYVFSGHPGSISSIADGRIRHYAYDRDTTKGIDVSDIRMVRNQKYDEIWMFTPGGNAEMLVWNYRNQSWTIRDQSMVENGSKGPNGPLFCSDDNVFFADAPGVYEMIDTMAYKSHVQRTRLPLTPEFTTETIGATALWYSSNHPDTIADPNPSLDILMNGTNKPAQEDVIDDMSKYTFDPVTDYKVDTRIQGRFMNYEVSDGTSNKKPWNLTGYQFEVMQGGKR